MSTSDAFLAVAPAAERANEALQKLARQWAAFVERVLSDPVARAAFERARKQPLPIRGGRGAEYRRRTRSRTRSRR